jgi:hypothetical protein
LEERLTTVAIGRGAIHKHVRHCCVSIHPGTQKRSFSHVAARVCNRNHDGVRRGPRRHGHHIRLGAGILEPNRDRQLRRERMVRRNGMVSVWRAHVPSGNRLAHYCACLKSPDPSPGDTCGVYGAAALLRVRRRARRNLDPPLRVIKSRCHGTPSSGPEETP